MGDLSKEANAARMERTAGKKYILSSGYCDCEVFCN